VKKITIALTLAFTIVGLALAKPSTDRELIIKLGFQPQSKILLNGRNENMNIGLSQGMKFFYLSDKLRWLDYT
jgi:hypothetical protein